MMRHRERAAKRLERHRYGWTSWDDRHPVRRIADRLVEAPGERVDPGASLKVRTVTTTMRKPVDIGPHAPLLKRVIRSPYPLSPVRPARVAGRPQPDLSRDV
ncbi:MAG: hypothetical protein ACI8PZ_007580, partial [Myxococcota bacterium]